MTRMQVRNENMKVGYGHRILPSLPPGTELFGFGVDLKEEHYGRILRPCNGTHSDCPLTVGAIVLQDSKPLGILSIDALGIDAKLAKQLSDRAEKELKISGILVVATHTHSAPPLVCTRANDLDAAFFDMVCEYSLQALKEAQGNSSVASLYRGMSNLDANCNYREYNKWRRIDRTVRVLNLRTSTQNILLVRFSCHPVLFGSDNQLACADFPGYLRRNLPEFATIFLNGCAASLNPSSNGRDDDLKGKGAIEANLFGKRLTESVREALESALPLSDSVVDFRTTSSRVTFETYDPLPMATNPCVITGLRIGDTYLIGFPGELFCETETKIAKALPGREIWVGGYTGGYFGYLVDGEAKAHADLVSSDYEAGGSNQSAPPNIGYKITEKDLGELISIAIEMVEALETSEHDQSI